MYHASYTASVLEKPTRMQKHHCRNPLNFQAKFIAYGAGYSNVIVDMGPLTYKWGQGEYSNTSLVP
jgi:hypothetical protein